MSAPGQQTKVDQVVDRAKVLFGKAKEKAGDGLAWLKGKLRKPSATA